jgi:tetratricopeptide (TPR) repeat protein
MNQFLHRLFVIGLLLIALCGCETKHFKSVAEKEDSRFLDAQQLIKEGQYEAALSTFLKVIATRDSAPESHLEAGQLYLSVYNDPILAIYHFRQYVMILPDSPQVKTVFQMIETAKKAFLRQLPGNLLSDNPAVQANFVQTLQQIRDENTSLKAQVTDLQQRLKQSQAAAQKTTYRAPYGLPKNMSETSVRNHVEAKYVVEAGDTLSRISEKVYGTPHRWKDIFQANRNVLPSPSSLKIGKQLVIPRR